MRVRRNDDGAAAVEFALVVPFLVVLFCGMIDFGLAYNARVTLTHAVREGVRAVALGDHANAEQVTKVAADGLNVKIDPAPVACSSTSPAELRAYYEYSYVTPLAEVLSLLPGTHGPLDNPVRLEAKGVMRCGT